ncbi:MAG: phosphoribosyltransferase [Eudoraea sp.]|nr:phosphoribosyltransferase [Eudoraea sp.]
MFEDRTDAGHQLAEALLKFKEENVVVIAIPRGGLPLGAIVAKALNAPLDVALSKKIGHPINREYAIGAVSLTNRVLSDTRSISEVYLEEETRRIRSVLKKRHDQYYQNRTPVSLAGKTVILVDDGVATGNTLRVTATLVQSQKPEKTIAAIPVAPPSAIHNMEASKDIDQVICLHSPTFFHAVGQYYEKFQQVSDAEAIQILEENKLV